MISRCIDRYTDAWMDACMDGWKDKLIDRQRGQADRHACLDDGKRSKIISLHAMPGTGIKQVSIQNRLIRARHRYQAGDSHSKALYSPALIIPNINRL